METKESFLDKSDLQIKIFRNEVGGAEIYCQNPSEIPEPVAKRLKELKLNILNQYPEILKNLKSGKKEFFSLSHDYNGFTIVISSLYD